MATSANLPARKKIAFACLLVIVSSVSGLAIAEVGLRLLGIGYGNAPLESIASEASIGPEVITADCGFVTPPGDLDRLVQLLRWFDRHRDQLPAMSRSARAQAERYTWSNYRSLVMRAVSKLI